MWGHSGGRFGDMDRPPGTASHQYAANLYFYRKLRRNNLLVGKTDQRTQAP